MNLLPNRKGCLVSLTYSNGLFVTPLRDLGPNTNSTKKSPWKFTVTQKDPNGSLPWSKGPPRSAYSKTYLLKDIFCNLHSVALPSERDSVLCIHSLTPSYQNFLFIAYLLHACYRCNPSHPSWNGEDYKSRNSTVCHFLQPPVAFFFSVPSISLRTPFSSTLTVFKNSPFLYREILQNWTKYFHSIKVLEILRIVTRSEPCRRKMQWK